MSQNSLPYDLDAIELITFNEWTGDFCPSRVILQSFSTTLVYNLAYYFNLGEKKTVKNNNTLDNIEANISHLMKVSTLRKRDDEIR